MSSCAVKLCRNSSRLKKKADGVTFHLFPTNSDVKNKWAAVLRKSRNDPQWQPSKYSVICSDHFDDSDFYVTKRGRRRVIKTKYPTKNLENSFDVIPDSDNTPSPLPRTSSAILNPSDAATDNDNTPSPLPSTSFEFLDLGHPQPEVDVKPTLLRSSPSYVFDFPEVSSVVGDKKVSPSFSSAAPRISQAIFYKCINQQTTEIRRELFGTPRKRQLRKSMDKQVENLQPKNNERGMPNNSASVEEISVIPDIPSVAACELSAAPEVSDDQESIFDTPRKHKMRMKIRRQEKALQESRKKIRNLQQQLRRQKQRNKSLHAYLKKIKLHRYRSF